MAAGLNCVLLHAAGTILEMLHINDEDELQVTLSFNTPHPPPPPPPPPLQQVIPDHKKAGRNKPGLIRPDPV